MYLRQVDHLKQYNSKMTLLVLIDSEEVTAILRKVGIYLPGDTTHLPKRTVPTFNIANF